MPTLDALTRSAQLLRRTATPSTGPRTLGEPSTGFRFAGIITNPFSKRNVGRRLVDRRAVDVAHVVPRSLRELSIAIARLHDLGADLLVIDGGDGTVRDVMSAGSGIWGSAPPVLCVVPSGKTNALSKDLGVPRSWAAEDAIAAARRRRTVARTPIEIVADQEDRPELRGFLFGAGAFVEATALAQRTHRAGAFDSVAVACALAWSMARTLTSPADSAWSRGSDMSVAFGDGSIRMHGANAEGDGMRYLMLASTLRSLPLGVKPFGRLRDGMKILIIDAPPRSPLTTAAALLAGSEACVVEERGCHRVDASSVRVRLPAGFILDGERYPGGVFHLRRGSAVHFLVP